MESMSSRESPTEVPLEDHQGNFIKTMRSFWWPWKWVKKRKSRNEDGCSLLAHDKEKIETWQFSKKENSPEDAARSSTQERYVKLGIGGAGNIRKCVHSSNGCWGFIFKIRTKSTYRINSPNEEKH